MTQNTETLGTALPALVDRCRKLLELYRSPQNHPACAFVIFNLERDISDAEAAIRSGDVVAQMRSFLSLKEYKS